MNIRQPLRAGSFYEGAPGPCRNHAAKLIDAAEMPPDLPEGLVGGLVPHAGWMYSGRLAALTFKALATADQAQTLVLFGADHVGVARQGELYDTGVWRTPLGDVSIDEELTAALLGSETFRAYPQAHDREHSLEVQVPLVQMLFPEARIVPVTVPPTPLAVTIGREVGKLLAGRECSARVVGSTDLTHHGGHFGSWGAPAGEAGVTWTEKNDRRMLDLIEAMDAEGVIGEADSHHNACGAGAIAATIAASCEMGATRGICLRYTNSYRVLQNLYAGQRDDTTVGYASVVFA